MLKPQSCMRTPDLMRSAAMMCIAFAVALAATGTYHAQVGTPEVRVDGVVPGAPADEAPGVSSSCNPMIARSDDGLLHAVWQDHRSPTWQIYYRRTDSTGVWNQTVGPQEIQLSTVSPS